MKVVTAAEMRQIDQDTIEGIGIPGIVLMETAGSAIVRAIQRHYPTCQRIGIFAGKGNNGGDGIVIARQLAHMGRDVHLSWFLRKKVLPERHISISKLRNV